VRSFARREVLIEILPKGMSKEEESKQGEKNIGSKKET